MDMISLTKRNHMRLAPLTLAAVLVIGACGSDDNSAEGDTVPDASDASSDASSDGGLMAPRPVRTAGGGAAGTAMSAASAAAPASDRMSTDMMMPYRITTFVAGDGLPALPGNDVGYLFEAGATVTAEQVTTLAAGLGVTGEPERIDDGYGVSWRVGPDDGTAPAVWVYEDAQLSWSYNSAWATAAVTMGCAVAEPAVVSSGDVGADGSDAAVAVAPDDSCVEPEPPVGVPTASEAETRARELMAAIGLDDQTFDFQPYADEWAASINAVEQVGGTFPGRRFDATFGAEGELQYAGGQLAEPTAVGPYDLVDLDTAIARLNDPSGFYSGYGVTGMGRTMMDVAVASDGAAPPMEMSAGVSGGAAGSEGSVGAEPMPVESMPPATIAPPEEVTVTLVDVAADVWWAYDVDGSVWLLPAYRFTGDDGGQYVVPAVTDQFLVQVPAEEMPAAEPVPAPDLGAPTPVDPMVPIETVPDMVVFDTSLLDASVGASLVDFTAEAESLGASVRVVEQDGVGLAVTEDYSPTRVNVAVTGEGDAAVVTSIVSVG